MKILFFLVFLVFMLDASEVLVSLRVEEHGQFHLFLRYHAAFNNYVKTCCKLRTHSCTEVMDSTGVVSNSFRSRTEIYGYNGGVIFTIWKAKLEDAGVYRCSFRDYPQYFADFDVEIQEVNHVVPLPPIKSTFMPFTGTSLHVLFKAENNHPSVSVGLSGPMAAVLAAILLTIMLAVSMAAIVLIRRRVKATDNTGADTCDSLHRKVDASPKSELPSCDSVSTGVEEEPSSVIYTTVDFKPHKKEEPSKLYANLLNHHPRAQDLDPAQPSEHQSSVEYATLALEHST